MTETQNKTQNVPDVPTSLLKAAITLLSTRPELMAGMTKAAAEGTLGQFLQEQGLADKVTLPPSRADIESALAEVRAQQPDLVREFERDFDRVRDLAIALEQAQSLAERFNSSAALLVKAVQAVLDARGLDGGLVYAPTVRITGRVRGFLAVAPADAIMVGHRGRHDGERGRAQRMEPPEIGDILVAKFKEGEARCRVAVVADGVVKLECLDYPELTADGPVAMSTLARRIKVRLGGADKPTGSHPFTKVVDGLRVWRKADE